MKRIALFVSLIIILAFSLNSISLSQENEQKLSKLQKKYDSLRNKYTEKHPDVIRLSRMIKKLKKSVEAEQKTLEEAALAAKEKREEEGPAHNPLFAKTGPEATVCLGRGKLCEWLNGWYQAGKIAGNNRDWYDNRDGGHSMLNLKQFPQISVVQYTEDEKSRKLHWGAQRRILKQITIGNSSTSANVRKGGSNPRAHYYTRSIGLKFLYLQYRNSNLYIYPEHRDHDPGHNGRPGYGDLYPTNTPYTVISQGSSGSDKVFVNAFVKTLAAFRPPVKEKLYQTGLLMPTLQMIFRSCNKNILNKKEYLAGKAHPTVFSGRNVDPLAMVEKARRIKLKEIPPLIQLKVIEEDRAVQGMDYFEADGSEKLADTPSVIARIFRRSAYKMRLVISAEKSMDINDRPLTYHWVVLRGDTKKISINPQDDGAAAELIVAYSPRQPISKDAAIDSNRVDIGVFADNGTWYSAPGFVTIFFLDNEVRTYDSKNRIKDIYYAASDTGIGYATSTVEKALHKGYDIFDWHALFRSLSVNQDDFSSHLLKKQFYAGAIEFLSKSALKYEETDKKMIELRKKMKSVKAIIKEHQDYLKQSKKELESAKIQHGKHNTPSTREKLKKAESLIDKAKKRAENLKQQNDRLRKEEKKLETVLTEIFLTEKIALKNTVKGSIEDSLNRVKEDLNLYVRYKKDIDRLVQSANRKIKNRFEKAKKTLGGFGLDIKTLSESSNSLKVSRSDKNLIEEFNIVVMNNLLFPHFLKAKNTKNFVDQLLTTQKSWRDVYHYSSDGVMKGWTRYDGQTEKEYTPAGNIVIERDKKGFVTKTQSVRYVIDQKQKTLMVIPIENNESSNM